MIKTLKRFWEWLGGGYVIGTHEPTELDFPTLVKMELTHHKSHWSYRPLQPDSVQPEHLKFFYGSLSLSFAESKEATKLRAITHIGQLLRAHGVDYRQYQLWFSDNV